MYTAVYPMYTAVYPMYTAVYPPWYRKGIPHHGTGEVYPTMVPGYIPPWYTPCIYHHPGYTPVHTPLYTLAWSYCTRCQRCRQKRPWALTLRLIGDMRRREPSFSQRCENCCASLRRVAPLFRDIKDERLDRRRVTSLKPLINRPLCAECSPVLTPGYTSRTRE